MKPGPKPRPQALRLLTTKPEKLRHEFRAKGRSMAAPPVADGPGDPPDDFDADRAARWRKIVGSCAAGHLTVADRPLLTTLVNAMTLHDKAAAAVARAGALVRGRHGEAVRNPAGVTVTTSAAVIARLAGELGLSPTSRTRLLDRPEATQVIDAYSSVL